MKNWASSVTATTSFTTIGTLLSWEGFWGAVTGWRLGSECWELAVGLCQCILSPVLQGLLSCGLWKEDRQKRGLHQVRSDWLFSVITLLLDFIFPFSLPLKKIPSTSEKVPFWVHLWALEGTTKRPAGSWMYHRQRLSTSHRSTRGGQQEEHPEDEGSLCQEICEYCKIPEQNTRYQRTAT